MRKKEYCYEYPRPAVTVDIVVLTRDPRPRVLLIRRKRFRFERTLIDDGVEKLEVVNARTGEKHLVVNPQLTDEEMNQVQEEVFRVLGWS